MSEFCFLPQEDILRRHSLFVKSEMAAKWWQFSSVKNMYILRTSTSWRHRHPLVRSFYQKWKDRHAYWNCKLLRSSAVNNCIWWTIRITSYLVLNKLRHARCVRYNNNHIINEISLDDSCYVNNNLYIFSLFHRAFWFIKFYSHQLMHFFIQLGISLLSYIKIT